MSVPALVAMNVETVSEPEPSPTGEGRTSTPRKTCRSLNGGKASERGPIPGQRGPAAPGRYDR